MHIIILGGGYGGLMTALRLSPQAHSGAATVTLVDAEASFSQRIRHHQMAAGAQPSCLHYESLFQGTGVRFLQGRVTSLEPEAKRLTVQTSGGPQTLVYQRLVYAPGSHTDVDCVPGVRSYTLTLDRLHAASLKSALQQASAVGGTVLVVGAGLTGIETAAEIAERHPALNVSLIATDDFGAAFSPRAQAHLQRVFARLGIALVRGRVAEVTAKRVLLADGQSLLFDVCVWAASFVAPLLARQAGFAVNARGQLLIDEQMQALHNPDVFGVGDAAAFATMGALQGPVRMACATAMPMGAHTADNLVAAIQGVPARPFRFSYVFRCISLGRRQALIQWVHSDDTPRAMITTGLPAVVIKELICRLTVLSITLERHRPGTYRWPAPRLAHGEWMQPHG